MTPFAVLYLLIALIAIATVAWLANLRRARQRWLSRLNLPGVWLQEDGDQRLQLGGAADHGDMVWVNGNQRRRGYWRLQGSSLVCDYGDDVVERFALRRLDAGLIGLSPAAGDGYVFRKRSNNVVPLPVRKD